MYLEETAGGSILAGVVIVVLLAWSLWLTGWLRRVELHEKAAPVVERLGLAFHREGFLGRIAASGSVDGVPVEVRWGRTVSARVRGGRWSAIGSEDVEAAVRALVGADR
jgi:hypothetical protein